jgi:hypothetical protein
LLDEAEGVQVWVREKPGIAHGTVTIGFGLTVLLVFDFNGNKFLCVFFWVHNGGSQRGTFSWRDLL